MLNRDIERIREHEKRWHELQGEPTFTDVRWPGAARVNVKKRVPASRS